MTSAAQAVIGPPGRSIPGSAIVCALALAIGGAIAVAGRAAPIKADPIKADWEHDWVALTVARNGAWGAASSPSIMRAMVQAIANCRRKSGSGAGDCGAEITTVRAAWSLAYACGEYTFIANGDTSSEARTAAVHRAIDLKEILRLDLPPCSLLVAIDVDGAEAPKSSLGGVLPVTGGGR